MRWTGAESHTGDGGLQPLSGTGRKVTGPTPPPPPRPSTWSSSWPPHSWWDEGRRAGGAGATPCWRCQQRWPSRCRCFCGRGNFTGAATWPVESTDEDGPPATTPRLRSRCRRSRAGLVGGTRSSALAEPARWRAFGDLPCWTERPERALAATRRRCCVRSTGCERDWSLARRARARTSRSSGLTPTSPSPSRGRHKPSRRCEDRLAPAGGGIIFAAADRLSHRAPTATPRTTLGASAAPPPTRMQTVVRRPAPTAISTPGDSSVASGVVELLQVRLDCLRSVGIAMEVGPGGVSEQPGSLGGEQVG